MNKTILNYKCLDFNTDLFDMNSKLMEMNSMLLNYKCLKGMY